MAVDAQTKKNVTDNWINSFSELYPSTRNKLYKIVGPFVIGLELINIPRTEDYRPHFVLYALFGNEEKTTVAECMAAPGILFQFYNAKNLQFDIPYRDLNNQYFEAVRSVESKVGSLFKGDICHKEISALIDEQMETHLVKIHAIKQAALYELKIFLAFYMDDAKAVLKIFDQIDQAKEKWNMQFFEQWKGSYDSWIGNLRSRVVDRDLFIADIELKKQDILFVKFTKSNLY